MLSHFFLSFGNSNYAFSQQNSEFEFIEYLKRFDSTIVFKENTILPKECFFALSVRVDTYDPFVSWMHIDNKYIIGIGSNLFPVKIQEKKDTTIENGDTLITHFVTKSIDATINNCDLFVYNKKTRQILRFSPIMNSEGISCRTYVTVLDLLNFIRYVSIFDKNHNEIGYCNFTFFHFKDFTQPRWRKIIYKDNTTYHISYTTEKLNKYHGKRYKLYNYSGFREFLDILMFYANKPLQETLKNSGVVPSCTYK